MTNYYCLLYRPQINTNQLQQKRQNSITPREVSILHLYDNIVDLFGPQSRQVNQHLTALLHVLNTHVFMLTMKSHFAGENVRTR